MSEFKHWLDESSDANDVERDILRSGLDADPSEAQREQVWVGLVGVLALSPLAAASASGSASGAKVAVASASKLAGVSLGIAKGFVLGLAVYGAAAGVSSLSERLSAHAVQPEHSALPSSQQRAARSAVVVGSAQPASAVPPEPSLPPAAPAVAEPNSSANTSSKSAPRAPAAEPLPSVAAFETAPSAARASHLQAEASALRRARAELRSGRLADAFATLEASRKQFSEPELHQEREALLIELLYRSGQVAAARERALDFLSRFANSPHAEQIRQFARP